MAAGDYQGTYAAEKVVVTIGAVIVTGFTDGDFITASYEEDRSFAKAGADGEVGRALNASKLGTITVTLSATSKANDFLSAQFGLASMAGITAAFPIGVVDLSGRTVLGGSKCWVKTAPEVTLGREIGDREWVFGVADLSMFLGGNG